MKNLRRMCAVVMLSCIFAVSTYAGDMHAGRTSEPLPASQPSEPVSKTVEVWRAIVSLALWLS